MTRPARPAAPPVRPAAPATRPAPPVARPKEHAEPFVWLLFSSGGVAAALVLPALLFLLGIAVPLGWVSAPDYGHLLATLRNPLTGLVLLGVFALALVHGAHRFRYTLHDGLQLHRYDGLIAAVCYGAALVGAIAAGYLLFGAR
jgi:fumarate reductase subunit D